MTIIPKQKPLVLSDQKYKSRVLTATIVFHRGVTYQERVESLEATYKFCSASRGGNLDLQNCGLCIE